MSKVRWFKHGVEVIRPGIWDHRGDNNKIESDQEKKGELDINRNIICRKEDVGDSGAVDGGMDQNPINLAQRNEDKFNHVDDDSDGYDEQSEEEKIDEDHPYRNRTSIGRTNNNNAESDYGQDMDYDEDDDKDTNINDLMIIERNDDDEVNNRDGKPKGLFLPKDSSHNDDRAAAARRVESDDETEEIDDGRYVDAFHRGDDVYDAILRKKRRGNLTKKVWIHNRYCYVSDNDLLRKRAIHRMFNAYHDHIEDGNTYMTEMFRFVRAQRIVEALTAETDYQRNERPKPTLGSVYATSGTFKIRPKTKVLIPARIAMREELMEYAAMDSESWDWGGPEYITAVANCELKSWPNALKAEIDYQRDLARLREVNAQITKVKAAKDRRLNRKEKAALKNEHESKLAKIKKLNFEIDYDKVAERCRRMVDEAINPLNYYSKAKNMDSRGEDFEDMQPY